jgi:hypothetical protein
MSRALPSAAITGCSDCKPYCKAQSLSADIVLLAGDTFDNHRVSQAMLQRTRDMLANARVPVVLLSGNHDSILPECLFRRAGLHDLEHVHVLGVTHSDVITFAEHGLEIRGRALHGFGDMSPLHTPHPRTTRWQIVMAHDHYVPPHEWDAQSHRAWRISDAALRQSALTMWRSAIGIARRASAMARCLPTIPVHRISQAPSTSFD